jgi:sulfate transport system permease protein
MTRPSIVLRSLVIFYVGALLALPLGFVFQQALSHGWNQFWFALHDHAMDLAIELSLKVVILAVPLNVLFGVGVSMWIVRHPSPLSRFIDVIIDIPLAISPIIVGLILELAYAQNGWFGSVFAATGLRIMFSYPAIVLASVFVSLPLVSRQVIPLLREVGDHQEQTAATLGAKPSRIFFTITMRSIAWAAAYGVTLTLARVLGEYGAVLIVSGNIALITQTLTLNIGANFESFNAYQGFVGALLLALVSVIVLVFIGVARHRLERKRHVSFV